MCDGLIRVYWAITCFGWRMGGANGMLGPDAS